VNIYRTLHDGKRDVVVVVRGIVFLRIKCVVYDVVYDDIIVSVFFCVAIETRSRPLSPKKYILPLLPLPLPLPPLLPLSWSSKGEMLLLLLLLLSRQLSCYDNNCHITINHWVVTSQRQRRRRRQNDDADDDNGNDEVFPFKLVEITAHGEMTGEMCRWRRSVEGISKATTLLL